MNNSFARLIDGMNEVLRSEALGRIEDDYARGQIYGVINLLNTFKLRADWSAGFLLQQLAAQQQALAAVAQLLAEAGEAGAAGVALLTPMSAHLSGSGGLLPPPAALAPHASTADLLAQREANNTAIGELMAWAQGDAEGEGAGADAAVHALPTGDQRALQDSVQALLRQALLAEVEIELKNSPRPLFAEMSGAAPN